MKQITYAGWRRGAGILLRGVLVWWVVERTVRWWLIRRFFQDTPAPPTYPTPATLTVVQPILSGDPHLANTLRANATLKTSLPIRWKWMVDYNDRSGQRLTADLLAELAATDPAAHARIKQILTPTAPDGINPKTYKLRLAWESGTAKEHGFFGVLDDDTRLLPGQLETAVDTLQREASVGLVFGLPYYRSFGTLWASLVSTFVNRNSLWSYLPILSVLPPPTINGMFWLARPEAIVAALDGFRRVEGFVCDDYAVARAVRAAGFALRQTAIVHPLQTGVADARAYDRLITRWFIFPQISLLRHEPPQCLAWFQAFVLLPACQLLTALVLAALAGGKKRYATVVAAQVWREVLQVQLERRHLPGASGRGGEFLRRRALGWTVDLLFPLQMVRAFLAPRVIEWRGHLLRLDPDGQFAYIRRRGEP